MPVALAVEEGARCVGAATFVEPQQNVVMAVED